MRAKARSSWHPFSVVRAPFAALLGALSLAACGGGGGAGASGDTGSESGESGDETGGEDEGGLPPIDPAICADMSFANELDEAVCDEIWGRGHEPQLASERELCRRLYVDLLGRLPTRAEFEADCEGRSVGAIVDDFMARPEYVRLGQRRWADILSMTSDVTYYEYIVELDALVGQLYTGELKLPAFAEFVATHPGFTGRFDGQDLVGFSFQAFLGRDAAPHERVGLEPLWHMWEERFVDTHPMYFFGYSPVVLNSIRCMGNSEGDCHSDLWGHHSVVIPVTVEGDYDYNGPNVYPVEGLGQGEWTTLRLPGRLIADHPTFYEAAADRAFERYLGYEAGAQLPRGRQRLYDMYVENGGDVRAVERELLTSILYTQASGAADDLDVPADAGTPDFWHGPMRQLTAEAWLDSISTFSGVQLGWCDHRFPNVQGGRPTPTSDYMETLFHPNDYPKDPDWPANSNRPDYSYRDLANLLGGCPSQQGQVRFTGTGVMIAVAQDAIAQGVCGEAPEDTMMLPASFDVTDTSEAGLTALAEHMYTTTTLQAPDEIVAEAIADAVAQCRDDSTCTPDLFAYHMCSMTLQSAPVIFY